MKKAILNKIKEKTQLQNNQKRVVINKGFFIEVDSRLANNRAKNDPKAPKTDGGRNDAQERMAGASDVSGTDSGQ